MDNREQEIKKLKNKRFNLREKIRTYVKKDKDAYELVVEFHNIINQLRDLGVKANIEKDYLQLEYWDKSKTSKSQKPKKNTPITEQVISIDKNSYVLCLAWIEQSNKTPIQVQKVKDYFEELGLECIGSDDRKVDENRDEYLLKYEFEGSDESFRMLKTCTQFVLDTFAQSDFDRFNIAVYGKKKNW